MSAQQTLLRPKLPSGRGVNGGQRQGTAAAGGGGILGAIDRCDKALSRVAFDAASAMVPRPVFILLEEGGDGVFWLVATILLFLWPGLPQHVRTVVANLFVGLLVDLALIGSGKGLFRRPRPQYNAGDMHVVAAVDQYSFPSGHASRVGFVVTYAWVAYHAQSPLLVAAALAWGAVTALSRALMGRHYVGDVCAGLALGCLTTTIVTRGTWALAGCWVAPAAAVAGHAAAIAHLQGCLAWAGLDGRVQALGEHYRAYLESVALKAAGGGANAS